MKLKKRLLYMVVWISICGLAGLVAAHFFDLSFWVTFGITAAALVLNGVVAEIEDRATGGFLKPRKKDP